MLCWSFCNLSVAGLICIYIYFFSSVWFLDNILWDENENVNETKCKKNNKKKIMSENKALEIG